VTELEHRLSIVEERVIDLLEERRWILRAIAGVAFVTVGQIIFQVLQMVVS
jgi:hypothetical protein